MADPTPAISTEPIRPLRPQATIEENVYAELRELIVSLQLRPGTRLAQRAVADRLGVSQTPVRVAIGRLAREGLISTRHGRATVTSLTRELYEEVLAARVGYEALAARLGAAAVTDSDIESMVALLATLRHLADSRNWREYAKVRWELHAICYRAAERPRLFAEVERMFLLGERYFAALPVDSDILTKSYDWNVDFVDACAARDANRADQIIIDGAQWGWAELAPHFPSERDSAPTE
jgi:DNA-binding GntR family transcriptional regulator